MRPPACVPRGAVSSATLGAIPHRCANRLHRHARQFCATVSSTTNSNFVRRQKDPGRSAPPICENVPAVASEQAATGCGILSETSGLGLSRTRPYEPPATARWLPTCSGTALEWPKSKLASLKGSVLPSARTKVRPRMRCCKKRGIIYTDGGEAPVIREPSLKIIGMLVGSIACRAFSSILQKPRAFPRPQHDWPIYDAPSDEFKGDGFSGSLFQNADGRRQSG